jgi:hypothetical protein
MQVSLQKKKKKQILEVGEMFVCQLSTIWTSCNSAPIWAFETRGGGGGEGQIGALSLTTP